jgi:hypothetical protein
MNCRESVKFYSKEWRTLAKLLEDSEDFKSLGGTVPLSFVYITAGSKGWRSIDSFFARAPNRGLPPPPSFQA